MNLEQMRKALADKLKGIEPIEAKAFAEDATEEDTSALEAAMSDVEKLQKQIKTAEALEGMRREAAAPVAGQPEGPATEPKLKSPTDTAAKVGLVMAGMVKAFKENGNKSVKGACSSLAEMGYEGLSSELMTSHARSLNSVDSADGGVIISETFAPDIIKLLYPLSSFMEGNPVPIPMPRGSYRQAAGASGAVASYRGEGDNISVSQPTFKELNMNAHLLSGIVPVTNQLLRYSMGAALEFAQNDLAMAMSTKMDSVAYLGTGVGDNPLGIMNVTGVYSTAATDSTAPTQANVDSDVRKLLNRFNRYPALKQRLGWRMSVTTMGYLMDMKDGNGNYVYPTLQRENPTFKGYPVVQANFPENLGSGTDETYLALIAFGHTIVGDAKGLELSVSDQASFKSGSEDVHLWGSDQTGIKATAEHDFTIRYLEAVAYLTGVKWGNA